RQQQEQHRDLVARGFPPPLRFGETRRSLGEGGQNRGSHHVAEHAVGSHLEPSASFLNCELTMKGCRRYFGSSTVVVTTSSAPSFGSGARSKYSETLAFSL